MVISEEAERNKPRKPLPAYFRYRTEKLKEFKDFLKKKIDKKDL